MLFYEQTLWGSMSKAHYPKANARTEIDSNLLGPCGFYCGQCLAIKKGVCLGCRYQAQKSEEAGRVTIFCDILRCSSAKGLVTCADCPEHPCERYEPDKSIFSKVFIDYLRNEVKKG